MEFANLNDKNFELFAAHYYQHAGCTIEEFEKDLGHFRHLKRLLRKYRNKNELRERLILNHIILLNNVFGVQSSVRMMFFSIETDLWPYLKTFLIFLDLLQDKVLGIDGRNINTVSIPLDEGIIDKLRNLT